MQYAGLSRLACGGTEVGVVIATFDTGRKMGIARGGGGWGSVAESGIKSHKCGWCFDWFLTDVHHNESISALTSLWFSLLVRIGTHQGMQTDATQSRQTEQAIITDWFDQHHWFVLVGSKAISDLVIAAFSNGMALLFKKCTKQKIRCSERRVIYIYCIGNYSTPQQSFRRQRRCVRLSSHVDYFRQL